MGPNHTPPTAPRGTQSHQEPGKSSSAASTDAKSHATNSQPSASSGTAGDWYTKTSYRGAQTHHNSPLASPNLSEAEPQLRESTIPAQLQAMANAAGGQPPSGHHSTHQNDDSLARYTAPGSMSRQELEAELQESRTQHSEATAHVRSLLRTITAMADENNALKEQVKVVHARASEVAQDAATSAGAYSKLQTEAASASLVQEQKRKEMIQAFKQESEQFKRAASTMEATMRRLASEKSKLAAELERISDERENMRSEAEAARTALRDSRSQIVTLKQRIVRLAGGSSLPHEMFGEEHVHIPGRGGASSVGRATSGGRSAKSGGAGTTGGASIKSVIGGKRLGQTGLHALDLDTMLMAMPPAMQLIWKEKQDALNSALERAETAENRIEDLQSHLSSLQGEYMLVAAGEDDSLLQRLKRRQLAAGFKPGEGRSTLHHPTQLAVAQRIADAVKQARETGNRDCLDVALYGAILGEPSLDDIHSVEVTPVGEETPLPKPLPSSAAAHIYTAAVEEAGDTLALSDTRRSAQTQQRSRHPHEGAAVLHKLLASSSGRPMGSTSAREGRSKGSKEAADVAERTVVVLRLLLAQSKAVVAVLRDQLKSSLQREGTLQQQLDEAHAELDPLLLTMEQARTQQHLLRDAAEGDEQQDPNALVAQRNALLKYSRQLEQREARLMEQVATLTDSVHEIRQQLTDEAMQRNTGSKSGSQQDKLQEAKDTIQQHPTAVLLEALQKAQQSGTVSHDALSAATSVTSQLRQLQVSPFSSQTLQ